MERASGRMVGAVEGRRVQNGWKFNVCSSYRRLGHHRWLVFLVVVIINNHTFIVVLLLKWRNIREEITGGRWRDLAYLRQPCDSVSRGNRRCGCGRGRRRRRRRHRDRRMVCSGVWRTSDTTYLATHRWNEVGVFAATEPKTSFFLRLVGILERAREESQAKHCPRGKAGMREACFGRVDGSLEVFRIAFLNAVNNITVCWSYTGRSGISKSSTSSRGAPMMKTCFNVGSLRPPESNGAFAMDA